MTAAALPWNDRGVRVTLPMRTVSENNAREHWRARAARRKAQRATVALAVRVHLGICRVVPPCVVTLTRISPSAGLDSDNLQGSQKAVRDAVADALAVNDNDSRVEWRYAQRRGKKTEVGLALGYGVEIRIEAA